MVARRNVARSRELAASPARPGPMLAIACTLCHSATAEQVRAALLGPDLLANAAATLAPVPVLATAWWLVTGGSRVR